MQDQSTHYAFKCQDQGLIKYCSQLFASVSVWGDTLVNMSALVLLLVKLTFVLMGLDDMRVHQETFMTSKLFVQFDDWWTMSPLKKHNHRLIHFEPKNRQWFGSIWFKFSNSLKRFYFGTPKMLLIISHYKIANNAHGLCGCPLRSRSLLWTFCVSIFWEAHKHVIEKHI